LLNITVKKSDLHGYGVFATSVIKKDETVEMCPYVILDEGQIEDTSILQDYLFGTPYEDEDCLLAPLGYAMLYNHSDNPNAEWTVEENEVDFVRFFALRDIQAGEEITHDYGIGYWDSRKEEENSDAA
jgi:SET domain-containing protein